MNTLLDKQYCHCCPNKSLNKKSKSLLQDPPESRGSGSGNGKCNDYWDPEYKHGPNYICEWWGQAIYSLKCFCLDYEGKDTFVDREEDS